MLRTKLWGLMVGMVVVAAGFTRLAQASPVSAEYTVTGGAGNYDLEFTVTNSLSGWPTLDAYYFGVSLSQYGVTGLPDGYQDFSFIGPYSNAPYGGSATVYNNLWIDFSFAHLFPGSSLGGFKVHISDLIAPTSIPFFVWAYDPIDQVEYTGMGNFNEGDVNDPAGSNPGFEGIALSAPASVPEPSTLCLGAIAALGLLIGRRWRDSSRSSLRQKHD